MSLLTRRPSPDLPNFLLVHGRAEPHPDVGLVIGQRYRFRECGVAQVGQFDTAGNPVLFDVELESAEDIEVLRKAILSIRNPATPIVCVVPQMERRLILRAHALGAEAVLHRPLVATTVFATLDRILARQRQKLWEHLDSEAATGLIAGTSVLEDLFAFAHGAETVTQRQLYDRADDVIDSLGEAGLNNWMDTLRAHHSQTYRHSLLVTGFAVSFGQQLGMRRDDLRRLSLSGLLHDIGKAMIPEDVLEKPGPLTPEESLIMRQHVTFGREILTRQGGFAPEMIDVVASHHEMLDGSGYPDGLPGEKIKDLVRVLTIADIFAALVEHRAYKAPMDCETAYSILESMQGKLDMALVRAFRPLAMRGPMAA